MDEVKWNIDDKVFFVYIFSNYCPSCCELLEYMPNDNTIRPVNNVVPRTINTDDDVILEFNTKNEF